MHTHMVHTHSLTHLHQHVVDSCTLLHLVTLGTCGALTVRVQLWVISLTLAWWRWALQGSTSPAVSYSPYVRLVALGTFEASTLHKLSWKLCPLCLLGGAFGQIQSINNLQASWVARLNVNHLLIAFNVLFFRSDRKRMSVIVRGPDAKIKLYVKGAVSIIVCSKAEVTASAQKKKSKHTGG